METSCVDNGKQKTSLWSVDSGFFFPLKERDEAADEADDDSFNEEL